MRILSINARYLPGYKGGGPIRTLAGMVERLGGEFRFDMLTSDRDSGDRQPYPGIAVDSWQPVGKAQVLYLSPHSRSLAGLQRVIRSVEHDVLYLNSFFCPSFSLKPLLLRWLGLLSGAPLVVAPRGEFSPGALGLKTRKKRLYLAVARAVGLYRNVLWQASSEYEARDIRRHLGSQVSLVVAPDLAMPVPASDHSAPVRQKSAGSLKLLFLSRIVRMKNLDGALKMLDGVRGNVEFSVFGPMEDRDYWEECQRVIQGLPQNISVAYHGAVEHRQVAEVMREHDLFYLPTLGENFGHVILEALVNGCPVLLSDRTRWRGLEAQGSGWDLSLDEPEGFRAALQQCVDMSAQEHRGWCQRALEHGLQFSRDNEVVDQNRALFLQAVSQR